MSRSHAVVQVDVPALWQAVALQLFRTEKTAQQAALLLGFSPSVMSLLKSAARGRGRLPRYQPSAPVLLSLCWWLSRDPRDFQVRPPADGAR